MGVPPASPAWLQFVRELWPGRHHLGVVATECSSQEPACGAASLATGCSPGVGFIPLLHPVALGCWLGRSCCCPWQPLPLWLWGVTAAEVVAPGAEQHLHSTQASSHSCSSPSRWAGRTRKWEGTQGAREVSHTFNSAGQRGVTHCNSAGQRGVTVLSTSTRTAAEEGPQSLAGARGRWEWLYLHPSGFILSWDIFFPLIFAFNRFSHFSPCSGWGVSVWRCHHGL